MYQKYRKKILSWKEVRSQRKQNTITHQLVSFVFDTSQTQNISMHLNEIYISQQKI